MPDTPEPLSAEAVCGCGHRRHHHRARHSDHLQFCAACVVGNANGEFHPFKPREEPEARGTGQFPPDAACVCGADDDEPCLGSAHETRWDGDDFKGSRCARHGGHKFQPAVEEPPVEGALEVLRAEMASFAMEMLVGHSVTEHNCFYEVPADCPITRALGGATHPASDTMETAYQALVTKHEAALEWARTRDEQVVACPTIAAEVSVLIVAARSGHDGLREARLEVALRDMLEWADNPPVPMSMSFNEDMQDYEARQQRARRALSPDPVEPGGA